MNHFKAEHHPMSALTEILDSFTDEDESRFVRVHDDGFLQTAKRLFMTATC